MILFLSLITLVIVIIILIKITNIEDKVDLLWMNETRKKK